MRGGDVGAAERCSVGVDVAHHGGETVGPAAAEMGAELDGVEARRGQKFCSLKGIFQRQPTLLKILTVHLDQDRIIWAYSLADGA